MAPLVSELNGSDSANGIFYLFIYLFIIFLIRQISARVDPTFHRVY